MNEFVPVTSELTIERVKELIEIVTTQQSTVVFTSERDHQVVLISRSEYESLKETVYLLSSPENAKRLHAAIEAVKSGSLKPQSINTLLEEIEDYD